MNDGQSLTTAKPTDEPVSRFGRKSRWILAIIVVGVCSYFLLSDRFRPRHWYASSIAFSPDGKRLVVGVYGWRREPYETTPRYLVGGVVQTVKSLDPSTGEELEVAEKIHSDVVRIALTPKSLSWIKFSPDGQQLAIGHWDGTTVIREVGSWKELVTLDGFPLARNVTFSPDGTSLCVGYDSGPIIWTLGDPSVRRFLDFDSGGPNSTAISPDGGLLAFASDWYEISIVDSQRLTLVNQFLWSEATNELASDDETEYMNCPHVCFTPSGDELAVACHSKDDSCSVKLINVHTGHTLHRFKGRFGAIRFSPNGSTMAIGGYKGLALIDMESRAERFYEKRERILDLAFSPDSTMFVLGDADGRIECRSTADGRVLWKSQVGGL